MLVPVVEYLWIFKLAKHSKVRNHVTLSVKATELRKENTGKKILIFLFSMIYFIWLLKQDELFFLFELKNLFFEI